jgi:hypothetical protein
MHVKERRSYCFRLVEIRFCVARAARRQTVCADATHNIEGGMVIRVFFARVFCGVDRRRGLRLTLWSEESKAQHSFHQD